MREGGFGVRVARHLSGPGCDLTPPLSPSPEIPDPVHVDTLDAPFTVETDPFGLTPVYETRVDGATWLASDPRFLRRLPGVGEYMDAAALHGYLCFSHVPVPLTLISGISAIPAGARVTIQGRERREADRARWAERPCRTPNETEAADRLRDLLQAAVAPHVPDGPEVGVFLSGGLDSSLVAALLREAGARLRAFTLDFGPPWHQELPFARHVASHLGCPLHVVDARPLRILEAMEPAAAALHQPFGDAVVVPLFLLDKAARDCVSLVFNGEGGDQLFGGWANKPIVAASLYGGSAQELEAAYLSTYHRFYGETDALYTPAARAATAGIDVGAWIRPALSDAGFVSLLHRLRAANLRLKGAQNIAPRAVQLAAAHGLRMVAPFFDRALTDWSFGVPTDLLLRGACEKYLLKRVAEQYLPPEVVWREKRGMGTPATEWCLGALRREVERRLAPRRLRRDGWFLPEAVAALTRGEDRPGEFRRRRVGEKLWALLMLHVWRDTHNLPFPGL